VCKACGNNKTLDSNNDCVQLCTLTVSADNCTRCAIGESAKCAAGGCVNDTVRNASTGVCEACAVSGCKTCRQGINTCDSCSSSLNQVNKSLDLSTGVTTFTCDPIPVVNTCPSNCNSCLEENLKCDSTGCDYRYYFDSGYCNSCGSNCLECSSDTTCTKCQKQYGLSDGLCKQCPEGYAECTYSNGLPQIVSLVAGY